MMVSSGQVESKATSDGKGRLLQTGNTTIVDDGKDDIFTSETPQGRVVVTNQAMGARCAVAADFDGDGRLDLVSASSNDNAVSWFRNEGKNPETGAVEFSIKKQITWNSLGSRIVTVADIDGDGDVDVVGASYYDSSLRWFENDGEGGFTPHLISSGVNEGQGVTVADIDNDGTPDVISASSGDNTIALFRNIDGKGSFCEIKEVVDDNAIGARTVVAADLNGDGWIDLASASKDDSTVAWYPNDGTGHFPTKIIISAGEESKGAYSLVAADIDQDGFNDLVVASNGNDHVSLWRNDGQGNFTKTLIFGNADFVLSVTAVDFDRDGDIDVASASFFDGHINWYENVDGKGYEWKNHTIYVGLQGHYVSTGDMDGDGDDDLIAVTHAENTVAVYMARTECDNSKSADCCAIGTQWNGTDCEVCPYGTYGTGGRRTAVCHDCPADECTIPGLSVIPATCAGITGCADVETKIARCACDSDTSKDPTTDVCAACPEGQVRPGDTVRSIDSLGNYSIWEDEQGACRFPEEEDFTPMIVGLVLAGILILAAVGLAWRRQNALSKSMALWTIDKHDIEYSDPIEVIGNGAFGEVLKGSYRGTEVAVKRVLPPTGHRPGFSSAIGTLSTKVFRPRDKVPNENGRGGDEESGLSTNKSLEEEEKAVNPGLQSGFALKSTSSGRGSMSRNLLSLRLMTHLGGYRKMKADFITEMRQLSRLRHPNITTTMGAVLSPGVEPLLVMEYMHNGSLYDAIRNDSIALDSREDILTIIQDIAHGLRFLHSAKPKVIHGDLKAKNVLIDSNFRAKVADFGLSAKSNSGARGTPYWMSPELIMQKNSNNAMSDVYAFGILLYEVYSRQNPYEGEDYEQVLEDVCDPAVSKRPPVPTLCPHNIASLYTGCLEMNPEARPTAQDIDTTLQAEGTIQGRVFRIEALNRDLVESNKRINSEQATQLAHFASMSHEIRTPLNCIIGVSSLLEEDEKLDASQVDLVQMIVSSGKLLRHVVDDVLDFSKFISGNAEIDMRRSDLQETLRNIISSMKLSPITERKQISLQTFYDPEIPQYFETDERRLQQILYNLLSNAVKFSKEQGMIDLSVSVVHSGTVFEESSEDSSLDHSLNFIGNKKKLRISIKDYGKGIDKSAFEKIFQPFVQTEMGVRNADGGTGLGLAITKQLTELLGGSISVDSKLGEWTEFSMLFPLTGIPVDTQQITSKLSKCCICLVSDCQEEIQWTVEACRHFNVMCLPFKSLDGLANSLAPFGSDSFIVYLVQNDLYDDTSYNALSKKAKSILITFGPNGNVDSSQIHYQSLAQVFPSAFMQQLIKFSEDKTPSIDASSRSRVLDSSARSIGVSHRTSAVAYEKLNVLVADDNLVNQKVLSRLLERLGVLKKNIQLASNGQEAVDLEAESPYHIVFMDIQMPVMDGTDACKRIIARHETLADNDEGVPNEVSTSKKKPRPKIVFLSAHVLDDYQSMCRESGATDYMTKPCTLQDLRVKLAKLTEDMLVWSS